MSRRRTWILLGAALPVAAAVGCAVGVIPIAPRALLGLVLDALGIAHPWPGDDGQRLVLWSLRVPRVLLAAGVGGGLAVAGATLQGLSRNPLVEPGLLGVSSGAALGVALVLVAGVSALGPLPALFVVPVAAFLGGLAAALCVFRLGRREGRTEPAILLLAGIAINALAGAVLGFVSHVADDAQLRQITFWMFGSFGGAGGASIAIVGATVVAGTAVLLALAPRLDVLLLGEAEARQLGIPVEKTRALALGASTLVVAAGVAASGIVGFIGLLCPHLVRLSIGPHHRALLPASALAGATLAIVADTVARTVVAPAELPVGIVTALVGGPVFLLLLLRRDAARVAA
jgi:iron complex transport system permease protein